MAMFTPSTCSFSLPCSHSLALFCSPSVYFNEHKMVATLWLRAEFLFHKEQSQTRFQGHVCTFLNTSRLSPPISRSLADIRAAVFFLSVPLSFPPSGLPRCESGAMPKRILSPISLIRHGFVCVSVLRQLVCMCGC